MSHKLYKTHTSKDSDDGNNYNRENSNDLCRACIVCPPCDYREKYDSDSSERSCPDFSKLCEDRPRVSCEKPSYGFSEKKNKLHHEDSEWKLLDKSNDGSWDNNHKWVHEESEWSMEKSGDKSWNNQSNRSNRDSDWSAEKHRDSDWSAEKHRDSDWSEEKHRDESWDNKWKKSTCKGCEKRCTSCSQCKLCGCNECSDHSRSSVASALGNSENYDCEDFKFLVGDQQNHRSSRLERTIPSNQKKIGFKKEHKDEKSLASSHKHHKSDTSEDVSWNGLRTSQVSRASRSSRTSHASRASDASRASGASVSSSSKGKKFVISFGPKEGHPWAEYNTGDKSIHINGKNGPVLHLYRECNYFFCVEQNIHEGGDPVHSFVLTNSPVGGLSSRIIPNGFAPVSKGCVCFKVDKCTPRYFFYQDSKGEFEGGLVIVHDAQ